MSLEMHHTNEPPLAGRLSCLRYYTAIDAESL